MIEFRTAKGRVNLPQSKDETGRIEKKQNYMKVSAAIKELAKIGLLKGVVHIPTYGSS